MKNRLPAARPLWPPLVASLLAACGGGGDAPRASAASGSVPLSATGSQALAVSTERDDEDDDASSCTDTQGDPMNTPRLSALSMAFAAT